MSEDLRELERRARAIGNGGQQQAGGEPMVSLNGAPTPVSVAVFAMLVDVRDTLVRIERMGGDPEAVSDAGTGPDDGAMGAQDG